MTELKVWFTGHVPEMPEWFENLHWNRDVVSSEMDRAKECERIFWLWQEYWVNGKITRLDEEAK